MASDGQEMGGVMQRIACFLLCTFSLLGAHYDCIFVGTSPLFLFEALYQHAVGKSVLILEEAPCCGGSWQSVDICGVLHADVGCHEIGNNALLNEFLQIYGGCSLLSFDAGSSVYFSGGCYELVHNLESRIQNTSIQLLKNHRVDRVVFDDASRIAIVESGGERYPCNKVYAPSYSYFPIGNEMIKDFQKTKYPHLYLLIYDPTPPKFSYRCGISNASRMMNLTHFVNLGGTGQQLIVFQTWSMDHSGEKFLQELKMQKLVDPGAYVIKAEWFTYEQYPSHVIKMIMHPCFEQLHTSDFRAIANHIARWKMVMVPFKEAVR
jgi:hypothetical protein